MAEYNVIPSGFVDADALLKNVTSLRELLNIELVSDADNILLIRRGLELMVEELSRLNYEVGKK